MPHARLGRPTATCKIIGTAPAATPGATPGSSHLVHPSASSASTTPLSTEPAINTRDKTSFINNPSSLARSASSTQYEGAMMPESDSDKKRNKLGYQRISIACGHCRRRKIRCLVAEGDPQNRCQNCIRLKKDCQFFPVDQPLPAESRSQASANTNTESASSSAVSPSPSETLGPSFEPPHDSTNYQPVPSNAPTLYRQVPGQPIHIAQGSTIHTQGTLSSPEYVYQTNAEARPSWAPNDAYLGRSASAVSGTMGHRQQEPAWPYPPQHSTGDFAPFPPQHPTADTSPEMLHTPSYPQWSETQWQHTQQQQQQQPLRSMSYSNIEGMPGGYAPQTYPFPGDPRHQGYHAAAPDVQNMPHLPQTHGSEPSLANLQQHPMYAHQTQYMFQQQGQAVSGAPMTTHPSYGGPWYAEPSAFINASQNQVSPTPEELDPRMRRPG